MSRVGGGAFGGRCAVQQQEPRAEPGIDRVADALLIGEEQALRQAVVLGRVDVCPVLARAPGDDRYAVVHHVGEYATIVRKAKGSNDWFLGSVGDDTARKFDVALDFLSPGKTYTAQIYRDGDDADYRTDKRHSIAIETRKVKKGDVLTIALAPGGGQAIRFKAGK